MESLAVVTTESPGSVCGMFIALVVGGIIIFFALKVVDAIFAGIDRIL